METLEEVAEQFINKLDFNSLEIDDKIFDAIIFGAKWQQEQDKDKLELAEHLYTVVYKEKERMYSEEEVILLLQKAVTHQDDGETGSLVTAQGKIRTANFYSWFEQFKKK